MTMNNQTSKSPLFHECQSEAYEGQRLIEGKDGYVGLGGDYIAIFDDNGSEVVYWHVTEWEEDENESAAPAALRAIDITLTDGASRVREILGQQTS